MYGEKIAGFADGFVKDGSVVRFSAVYWSTFFPPTLMPFYVMADPHAFSLQSGNEGAFVRTQEKADIGVRNGRWGLIFFVVINLNAQDCKLNHGVWGELRRRVNE